jgi:hypothetical protein
LYEERTPTKKLSSLHVAFDHLGRSERLVVNLIKCLSKKQLHLSSIVARFPYHKRGIYQTCPIVKCTNPRTRSYIYPTRQLHAFSNDLQSEDSPEKRTLITHRPKLIFTALVDAFSLAFCFVNLIMSLVVPHRKRGERNGDAQTTDDDSMAEEKAWRV